MSGIVVGPNTNNFVLGNVYEIPGYHETDEPFLGRYAGLRLDTMQYLFFDITQNDHRSRHSFNAEYLDEIIDSIIHHPNLHKFYE